MVHLNSLTYKIKWTNSTLLINFLPTCTTKCKIKIAYTVKKCYKIQAIFVTSFHRIYIYNLREKENSQKW